MEIIFLQNGKTESVYLQEGVSLFEERIAHYIRYKSEVIPTLKNTKNYTVEQQKEKEGEAMQKYFEKVDLIILLDEKGKEFRSVDFAGFLQQQMNKGIKKVLFVVGGAYGFAPSVYAKAHEKIALSKMTFSHQMVRLLFVEQLYRALTILKGEPYHNE